MTLNVSHTIANALKPFAPLFNAFKNKGFQLYAVGGCVRDWVLGQTPKDIDFTTDAVPEQTKAILSENGYRVIPVGELFGTIATVIGRKNYEITTFRVKESYTRGSRHPIVCYGKDLERDLERRDLTINAMAASQNGDIIDPFQGLQDLENRVLRVPKSSYAQSLEIFGDDPLRILRLARFKARLQFDVCEEATQAARDMAGSVLSVSHERWFSEIDGMLKAKAPQDGIQWLEEIGVWQLLFPEMIPMKTCHNGSASLSGQALVPHDQNLMTQAFSLLHAAGKQRTQDDTYALWAALFLYMGHATTSHGNWAYKVTNMLTTQILQRLKVSNAHVDGVTQLLTPLPKGDPTYRTARELAIDLHKHLESWFQFQTAQLEVLPSDVKLAEAERLDRWKQAISPWLDAPQTADVQLPKDLSQALTAALGIRGKTLGLCITMCKEAVLDQYLKETDPVESFVKWVEEHFSE